MAAYRKRMIGCIALFGVIVHAYALVSHQMRMVSAAPAPATALSTSSADADVTRQILALSVMCRASAESTASHDSGSDGSQDVATTCPICAGIAIASPLPSPSSLMIERLASAIVFEPTAHIAVGDLLRDALPPPRGPPSLV